MPRQRNTREIIISSAFLMYRKKMFKEFSLNDVAREAKISKTAIFRHFKNKADLLSVMDERYFDATEVLARQIQRESEACTLEATRRAVDLLFDFDAENPGYIEYYLQSLMGSGKTAELMVKLLVENLLQPFFENSSSDEKKGDAARRLSKKLVPLYTEVTILYFLISRSRFCKTAKNAPLPSERVFRDKVASIVFNGLGRQKNPISAKTKKELDNACRVKLSKDENEDRFFSAFVNAIEKSGGFNITVENIASELGMAKSSMYAFFANKTDYMKNMLRQETEFYYELLQERCLFASNADEMIYILMRFAVNYLLERPEVVLLHGYFSFHDMNEFDETIAERHFNFLDGLLPDSFELGFNKASYIFMEWISVLMVTVMCLQKKHKFPLEWCYIFVSAIFEFVECGTKYKIED